MAVILLRRSFPSVSPAIVYFPAGTYVVSSSIIDYYFTQLIGNPNSPAVLKATAGFTGLGLIDGDQYQSSGNQGWGSTNVFYRQIEAPEVWLEAGEGALEVLRRPFPDVGIGTVGFRGNASIRTPSQC